MGKKSCWYYDNQLRDPMTRVSLHANTFYDSNSKSWKTYKGNVKDDVVDDGGYYMVPLCTSILAEDFSVSVANTWTETSGDFLSELWNGTVKKVTPFLGTAKEMIDQISASAQDRAAKEGMEENKDPKKWGKYENPDKRADVALTNALVRLGDLNKNNGDRLIDYANSVLISQGTRFKYYSGTGVSFGNLQMRFTLFPIWTKDGSFKSVPQQLEDLFPYAFGYYRDLEIGVYKGEGENKVYVSEDELRGRPVVDGNYKLETGETREVSTLLGWQHPPAGYAATYRDIDKGGIKGTLKLRIGPFYVLESIVCESMAFNLSRQMVKRPSGIEEDASKWYGLENDKWKAKDLINFSPLFCDVVMTFSPATKYSDQSMRQFIYGQSIIGGNNEVGATASNEMTKRLEEIKQNIAKRYGNV